VHITAGVYMRGACSAPLLGVEAAVVSSQPTQARAKSRSHHGSRSQLSRRRSGEDLEVGGPPTSLPTQRAVHAAGSLSDCLGAALLLAAVAPAMRDAVRCAACSRRLGAALVLAPPAPSMRLAVMCAEAEAHRGASGAGDRKRTAGGAGLAEMHAARVGWGDAVPGERWRHTARVTTDAVGGWRGPLVPAAVSADSERRGRAVPVPRDDVAKSRGHAGHGLVGDAGRGSGRAAPFLGRRAQAERMLCACGGSCGDRGGGVVHGVADGGLWVWGFVGVTY
jgi:hypothetical protein